MLYRNGDRYEGDFVDGKREGKGKAIFSNGGVYERDFVDGRIEGKGEMALPDRTIYRGFVKEIRWPSIPIKN